MVIAAILLGQLVRSGDIQWRHKIESRAQFDQFARLGATPYTLPHLRFTVDRKSGKIYYYDSRIDRHHRQLANATYLSLETADEFFRHNYLSDNRRFILGWIGYHQPLKKWAFEFWEGDTINRQQIAYVSDLITKSFFAPAVFKPNSLRQQEASAGMARIMPEEIHASRTYEAVNLGQGIGRLRFVNDPVKDEIHPTDIVVLGETPISLTPCAGIVFSRPTTPLSHLNLMARQWRIPSACVRNVDALKKWEGKLILYRADRGGYAMRPATAAEQKSQQAKEAARLKGLRPKADLSVTKLARLSEQSTQSSIAFGAKSANLGAVATARIPSVIVPPGFTIPFAYYREFVKLNSLDKVISSLISDPKGRTDPAYRNQRLQSLREAFARGRFSSRLRQALVERIAKEHPGKGLFVRSSTNAEDLKDFSGAGLYTTVPNVVGAKPLEDAIRVVWGSIWNDIAYSAREQAGIPHDLVFMAVLIQEGINADSAGVMVTENPFDPRDRESVYISAKRGLGIRVVEGKRVPEQLIFRPKVGTVTVLTRSAEDSLLTFDANGGVKEIPIDKGRNVLTNEMTRRLATAGAAIERLFRGVPQDIEWIVVGKQVYIVQSRPFLSDR